MPDPEFDFDEWYRRGQKAQDPPAPSPSPRPTPGPTPSPTPTPAPAPTTPDPETDAFGFNFSEWYARESVQAQEQIRRQFLRSRTIDPGRAARVIKVSGRTRLPHEMVDRNLDDLEREVAKMDFNPDTFVRSSPTVARWVKESPYYSAMPVEEIQRLAELEDIVRRPRHLWRRPDAELEAMADRLSHRELKAEKATLEQAREAGLPEAPGMRETDDEMRLRIKDRILKELRAEEDFVARTDTVSFGEVFSRRSTENPLFWLPFGAAVADAGRMGELYFAAKAVQEGNATDDQRDFLVRFGRLAEAEERRGRGVFGTTASIVAELPAFVGEFVLTGPIYKSGKVAAERLIRESVAEVLKGRARTLVREGVGALVGSAARTATQVPRLVEGTIERAAPRFAVTPELEAIFTGAGDDFLTAFLKSAGDLYVENVSELTGGGVERVAGGLKRAVAARWIAAHPKEGAAGLLTRLKSATGWHGVLGEMFEERVGEVGKAALGIEEFHVPTAEQLAAEALAFSLPGAVGSTGRGIVGAARWFVSAPDQRQVEALRAMGKIAAESELLKSNPDLFESILGEALKPTDKTHAHVDVDDWNAYWQSQKDDLGRPIDPRAKANEVAGNDYAYDEAMRTGGDIAIRTERYVRNLGATEHHEFFQSRLRFDPLDESVAAAEAATKAKEAQVTQAEQAQAAEKLKAVEGEVAQPEDPVAAAGRTVFERLVESGESPATARYNAEAFETIMRTLGGGLKPENLQGFIERFLPQIRRLQGPRAAVEAAAEVQELHQPAQRPIGAFPIDPTLKLKPVDLVGGLLQVPAEDLFKTAAKLYTEKVQGTEVDNPHLGRVRFSRLGRDFIATNTLKVQRMSLVPILPQLAAAAVPVERKADRKGRPDVTFVHAVVPVRIDGITYAARLVFKEGGGREGANFYTLFGYDIERLGVERKDRGEPAPVQGQEGGPLLSGLSLPQEVATDPSGASSAPARESVPAAELEFTVPELADAVKEDRQELFQPGQPDEHLGGYVPPEFTAGSPIINLYRGANLSTFIHESGHLFLDAMVYVSEQEGAPQYLKDDVQTVLKWFGVKDVAAWNGMSHNERRQYHEKFAVGFEQYFLEGEAPTPRLQQLFQRFRAWLTTVYRKLTNLGVNLTPEVRRVMDRLVATEEELSEAHAAMYMRPLLDPNRVGMTPQQAAEYQEAIAEAKSVAEAEIMARMLKDVRRERTAWWKEQRAQVRSEVETAVNGRKEWVALARLQRGTLPDGSPLPEGQEAFKLDREVLEALYPAQLKGLPPRVTSTEDGIHPDIAAEMLGFTSADEMLLALARTQRIEGPSGSREAELRGELDRLQGEREALELLREPLAAEAAEATKEVLAGREVVSRKIAATLRSEEEAKVRELAEILKDIRSRGGVQPVEMTENLPKELRAAKGKGVPSDELAQEFADRGLIKDAYTDDLYDFLNRSVDAVRASKERLKEIPERAKKLARGKVKDALDALLENARQQEQLREELGKIKGEERRRVREAREALIERTTDQVMAERFGTFEPDTPESAEEAIRAIHTTKRAELFRKELQYLASKDFATFKGLARAIARPVPTVEAIRAEAQRIIAEKRLRDIRPALYQRAEAKAGREAMDAMLRGDFAGAFEAKERQLLNHELFAAASDAIGEADRMVEYLAGLAKLPARQRIGKAGEGYLEQIDQILERFDLRYTVTLKAIEKRKTLQAWANERKAEGLEVQAPEELLNEAYRKHFRDATVEELRGIHDTVKHIEHLAGVKTRLLKSAEKRDFDSAVDDILRSLRDNAKGEVRQTIETRLPAEDVKHSVGGFFAAHRKFASVAREMDGWKDGGVMWGLLVRPFNAAADQEATMRGKAADRLHELFGLYDKIDWVFHVGRMYRKIAIPTIPQGSLTKMATLMVALNWGNLDSRRKLMEGYDWSEIQVQAILDTLDERDWKFVTGVWGYINEYWPEVRALNQRVNGIAPDKVEGVPVVTKYGTFDGAYFPLMYDGRQSERAGQNEVKDILDRAKLGATARATTRHGHRKARIENVHLPVRLDVGVIFQHVNDVIHDLTHYETLLDVGRLLADERIQGEIRRYHGGLKFEVLKKALEDVAAGSQPAQNSVEKALAFMRRGTAIAAMGWKLMTALKQPLGFTQSFVRVGPEWVARGISRWLGSAQRMEGSVDWIYSKSEFMKNRSRTQVRELNEVRNSVTTRGALLGKLDETYFWLIVKMQQVVDVPTWLGAYEKAMAETPEIEQGLESAEKRAIAMADQAVIDSQGSGHIKDLAEVERRGEVMKALTLFYTYMNTTFNLTAEVWKKTDFRSPKDVGRLSVDLLLLYAVPAFLTVTLEELLRGGDDDKTFAEKLAREQLSYLMGTMVVVRELSGPVAKGYGYEGPAGIRGLAALGRFAKQMGQGEIDDAFWRAMNEAAGTFLHYPAGQVQATVGGLTALLEGETVNPLALAFGAPRR